METKRCVLYDRVCIECGECNMCDLDPMKVCDNCGKCIGLDHTDKSPEYRAIKVDGIIDETMNPSDYLYDEETLEVPEEDDDIFGDDLFSVCTRQSKINMNPEQFREVCFALFGVLFETNLSEKRNDSYSGDLGWTVSSRKTVFCAAIRR